MNDQKPKLDSDEVVATTLDTYGKQVPRNPNFKDTDKCSASAHDKQCDEAMEYYQFLVHTTPISDSIIPKAIELYRKHGEFLNKLEELAESEKDRQEVFKEQYLGSWPAKKDQHMQSPKFRSFRRFDAGQYKIKIDNHKDDCGTK